MSELDSAQSFPDVWAGLGKLRERLELSGYDVTAEGLQLLNAIATLETAWKHGQQRRDVKFYDDIYLQVRKFGTDFGSRDKALPQVITDILKMLVDAKKTLIGSETGRGLDPQR